MEINGKWAYRVDNLNTYWYDGNNNNIDNFIETRLQDTSGKIIKYRWLS